MSPATASRTLLLFALGLGCAPLLAQVPGDFARQWPIQGAPANGLVRIELSAEVYAALTRSDLGDLSAFDADGRALALEPVAPPPPPRQRPEPTRLVLPLFRVPAAAAGDGSERIALLLTRDADGRLRRLQADIGPETAAPHSGEVLLLDASGVLDPLQTLVVELAAGVAELDARVALQGSDDLSAWHDLGAPQALVRLEQDGLRLERTRLALGGTRADYLRLRRVDSDGALPIERLAVEVRRDDWPVESGLQRVALSATPDAAQPGRFRYRVPGPLPVERLLLAPADGHGAFTARVASRSGEAAKPQARAELVVFQLGDGADAVRADPVPVPLTRDAEWIVDTHPAQAQAPRLEVEYSPEQVLVLAQGPTPLMLVAGSARAQRAAVPLQPLLAQLRTRHGDGWLVPLARLGPGRALAGEAALEPAPRPVAWRQILLWLVLGGGGLLVIGLVLRLLHAGRGADPPMP